MFRSFVAGLFTGGASCAVSQGAAGRPFSTSVIQSSKSVGALTITTIPEFPTYFLATPSPSGGATATTNTEDPSVLQKLVNKVWSAGSTTTPTSSLGASASNLHLDTISNTTDTIYVLARVKADDEILAQEAGNKDTDQQPSMNLSVALDVSGSMEGSRLEEAKEALMFMIKQCTPRDYVSIALFETEASVALEPTQMDEKGQARALAVVKEFEVSGLTNLSAGIEKALGLLKDHSSWLKKTLIPSKEKNKKKRVNASLAFTDGYANQGIYESTDEICRFLSPKVEEANAALHTFGFGAHHNEEMLKRIAGVGSGSYYFIDSPEKMKEVFADCLGGVMSTVAQDIKLTIKPRPGFYVDEVFTSYKKSTSNDNSGEKTVTLRDLYRSEQRDVLIRLRRDTTTADNNNNDTPGGADPKPAAIVSDAAPTPFVEVDLSYDSLSSGQREQGQVVCGAKLAEASSSEDLSEDFTTAGSSDIRDHKVRFAVLEGMDESRNFASNGEMEKAKDTLATLRSAIWPSSKSSTTLTETEENLQKDVDLAIKVMDQTFDYYSQSGSKSMLQQMESHKYQRYAAQTSPKMTGFMPDEDGCSGSAAESSWSSSWDTSAKKAMRAKATTSPPSSSSDKEN